MCTTPGCTNPRHKPSLDDLLEKLTKAVREYAAASFDEGAVPVGPNTDWRAKQDEAQRTYRKFMKARDALADRIKELTR